MAEYQTEQTPKAVVTAAGRYAQLRTARSPVEARARDCAAVTLPSLFPPEGTNDTSNLPQPWQSVGSRGTNNLAAKLMLVLLPPGASFFRLEPNQAVLRKLAEKSSPDQDIKGAIESALSKVESIITTRLNATNFRSTLAECLKQLIVTGNALLVTVVKEKKLSFKFFPLSKFAVSRDNDGNVLEIVTCEGLSYATAGDEVRSALQSQRPSEVEAYMADPTKSLELYTWVRRENSSWTISQEVCGIAVGEAGTFPLDQNRYIPLRWNPVSDSSYGRGHAEEYLGDLMSLESLSQSIVEGASALAKTLIFVNPAGATRRKDIKNARNLEVLEGDAKDVTTMQFEKAPDFSVAQQKADGIEKRLEQAFLLDSSFQRNAERVTAEEIRVMAAALEQSLGGVYSTFAPELQLPLIQIMLGLMTKWQEIPTMPKDTVQPQIITGLEGLGRTSDLTRLDQFIGGALQELGPQVLAEWLNVPGMLARRAAALSIDTDGLINSQDQVDQTRAAAAKSALAQQLGPHAIAANSKRDVAQIQAASSGAAPDAGNTAAQ